MRSKGIVLSVLILLLLSLNSMKTQTADNKLNELRAFFIYTISSYVEWPDLNKKEILIGVFDNSELEKPLKKISKKKKVKGKKMIVKKFSSFKGIEDCQIIIISESEKKNLKTILSRTDGKQILTVSYSDGLAKKGVCINLINSKGKLAFEVNEVSLRKNNLKASSQLLKLAKKIY